MPGTDARTFAWAAALFARSLNFRYDGIAIASRIPMMMMTTRSSIRVKPDSSFAKRLEIDARTGVLLPDGLTEQRWHCGVSAAARPLSPLDRGITDRFRRA